MVTPEFTHLEGWPNPYSDTGTVSKPNGGKFRIWFKYFLCKYIVSPNFISHLLVKTFVLITINLSIYLYACPSIQANLHLTIDLFNHNPSICVFIYLFVFLLYIRPSDHIPHIFDLQLHLHLVFIFKEWAIKEKTLYVSLWKTDFKHKNTQEPWVTINIDYQESSISLLWGRNWRNKTVSGPAGPSAPKDVLEALEQRRVKYVEASNQAKASGDDRKARMHDRIAKVRGNAF